MSTADFIESLRSEISTNLKKDVLCEVTPLIERRLYHNVFDIHQAARYLNRSEGTLRRMIDEKECPFFKQRGQFFFRQTDLDRWIDEQVQQNYPAWREQAITS